MPAPNFSVSIVVPLPNERVCHAILSALEPDNRTAPPGITIDARCNDSALIASVIGIGVNILTWRNTIDDLLAHVALALKLIELIGDA